MELLVAMMAGAAGAAMIRGSLALALATGLGIFAGAAAFYLLALVGPGLKAGPLVLIHIAAGGALGAGLAFVTGMMRRRVSG